MWTQRAERPGAHWERVVPSHPSARKPGKAHPRFLCIESQARRPGVKGWLEPRTTVWPWINHPHALTLQPKPARLRSGIYEPLGFGDPITTLPAPQPSLTSLLSIELRRGLGAVASPHP